MGKKSKLSWQDEYNISSAAFKVANIMIDCKYDVQISNLRREIEILKRENNKLMENINNGKEEEEK